MISLETDMAECIIHIEIKDWFKKLITETCGPTIHIRYLPNDDHFNSHTNVEISGTKIQVNQAVEIIRNTYDKVRYEMPWLNENTYFIDSHHYQEKAKQALDTLQNMYSDFHYICYTVNVIGNTLLRFNFRPDLNDEIKMILERLFSLFRYGPPIFIMYPKIRVAQSQTSSYMATNILTAFHGKFLSYLNTEDIFSLELANKGDYDSCYDADLDHDIQKFLREECPDLYGGVKIDHFNLKDFRINEVLRYFIHKYHDRFTKISIPNILTAHEIQLLSRSYNIEIEHYSIIHIDFKSTNDLETIDFCAIYHCDPNRASFLNYDAKYATENYSINFRADGSLDPLQCNMEFSYFVLKSQINCSPQKSNSVLKYLTKYFKANQNISIVILNEFDLNHASNQILSSLLVMMSQGALVFYEMNFTVKTLVAILEHSENNWLVFKKCHIALENVETLSNMSTIKYLQFFDMEIDLSIISILKNIENLEIDNCQIVGPSWEVPINIENVNNFYISLTSLDITTVQTLMKGCARTLFFMSCYLTASDHFAVKIYFTVRNHIFFENMIFGIQLLFQIFENCEFLNPVVFEGCHFRFENDRPYNFSPQPMNVVFQYIKFDSSILLTILAMLNKGSMLCISKSRILPWGANADDLIKKIQLKQVEFCNCRLEIATLLNILGKMSRKTAVWIDRCDLLNSNEKCFNILTNLSKINFRGMKINSQDLYSILGILKVNSSACFDTCEITGDSEEVLKINHQHKIIIYFENMTIPSHIARSLLHTDWTIAFDNCYLQFMTDEFADIAIQTNVIFRNMTFDSYEHLKCLAKLFSSKSKIEFDSCHFDLKNCRIPNIVIKPFQITFHRTSFDLDVLVTIMEIISEQTKVFIVECHVQSITQVFSRRPIKFKSIHFVNMNLEIEIILCILKNFTSLSQLHFVKCKIVCSNPNQLSNTKLQIEEFIVENMDIDIQIFYTFVQKCIKGVIVSVENCKIIPARNNIIPYASMEIGRLVLKNVDYSPELLQILQYLNAECFVEYQDQLSIQTIAEICTNTPVHGNHLILTTQICTESIYFEFFAEFFRPMALNFECDTEVAYDLPTYLIPDIRSLSSCSKYNWDLYKIKFIAVNDAAMKVEFLKNYKPIDLYFVLNDLLDDSEENVVDYN